MRGGFYQKVPEFFFDIHSVLEHKKWYIRNYTQVLENLRNAIVGLFGLRNEFVNVQRNKKRNTQNIQVKKQKKPKDKPKRSHRVDYNAMAKGHKAKKSK